MGDIVREEMRELGNSTREVVTKWIPTTDRMMLRRFGKLTEEAGELIAVTGRCVCQGIDEIDPSTGLTNRRRLEKEIADVYTQLDLAIDMLQLDASFIWIRRGEKREAMYRWEQLSTGENS